MAAAFAALVSLQNNLLLTQTHPLHSFSFDHKQIQSLKESTCFLIEFMKSNDDSHGARKEAAEALEMRIARAAEAAEDVIETHVVDQIRSGRTRSKTRSCRFFLDVQKVVDDMDYMLRKAINIKARSGVERELEQPSYSAAVASSSTPLTSNQTSTVGFDDLLLQLLDKLTGVPSSRQVIPIVGMGGIGKTTLATNAFKHPLTLERFDVCLWATISQQYSLKNIIAELVSGLEKFTSQTSESTSGTAESTSGTVDDARVVLHKSLYGRRYLIILDDMWSVHAWDEINRFFPNTDNGSRIVVTTRNSDVAYHLSISRLAMSFLNEDNSWDLFCQKAFAEQGCPHELEEIGKKIVEKCKGLPLAIVVVGGHLKKSSMNKEYWQNVALDMNSILDNSTENDQQCLNVLSLSYSYLPVHLKPCFLLMGAFPEDQEIDTNDVVELRIAEGFIEPFENTHLEEVAEAYLTDLYERNLILVDEFGYDGRILNFKVHDLVRELCLKIAKDEEFLYVFDTPRAISRERRVVISGKVAEVQQDHQTITFDAPIRCLIYEGGWLPYDLKLLRTLNKVVTASTSESTFQQLNLRLLEVDIKYNYRAILYLPSSISLLWNLQLLNINLARSTVIAPYEIWEMLQLRILQVGKICLVDPLPVDRLDDEAIGLVLRNLQTLRNVENLRLSEEVCKRIPNIRVLFLSYCDEASLDYCPHNLGYFHQLETLVLQFDSNPKWHDIALKLTFPTSLERLRLIGSRLDWEELTMMVGSLPNLMALRLWKHSVIGSVWTPAEGKFLGLKGLGINGCDDLIHWNADSSSFPALQTLHLKGLSKLEEFPSGIGEIPTLKRFRLENCSESSTISAMRTLVEQVDEQGNEDLKLFVTFRGDEETLHCFNNKVREEGLENKNLYLDTEKLIYRDI